MNTIFGLKFCCFKFNDILKTCNPNVDFFQKILLKSSRTSKIEKNEKYRI